jgi:DNA end-binding protein Ku
MANSLRIYFQEELCRDEKSLSPTRVTNVTWFSISRRDTYRENVERLIEEKKKGEKITTVKQPRKAPVTDLMDALKKSLQSKARPGRSEQPSRSGKTVKKPARKRKAA